MENLASKMNHLISDPNNWIPTELALPAMEHVEDEGYYSRNVITKDERGDITIARINHAPNNWFSTVREEEIETKVEFWCALDCEGESIAEKYDILHDTYGFMLEKAKPTDDVKFNPLQDYVVAQCQSSLGVLGEVAFYHELISLAWVKHLELTA